MFLPGLRLQIAQQLSYSTLKLTSLDFMQQLSDARNETSDDPWFSRRETVHRQQNLRRKRRKTEKARDRVGDFSFWRLFVFYSSSRERRLLKTSLNRKPKIQAKIAFLCFYVHLGTLYQKFFIALKIDQGVKGCFEVLLDGKKSQLFYILSTSV